MEFMSSNILHFISSTHLMQICSQGSCFFLSFKLLMQDGTVFISILILRYISGDGLMSSQAQTLLYNC